jgi:hypothetical protein
VEQTAAVVNYSILNYKHPQAYTHTSALKRDNNSQPHAKIMLPYGLTSLFRINFENFSFATKLLNQLHNVIRTHIHTYTQKNLENELISISSLI